MQLFGTYTKFKQVVLYRLAKDMAGPELQELRKTWDKMNFDNVEAMGSVRLLDGLEVAGFTLGEREGSDLLKRIDVLNTGGLTFEEFAAAILDWVEIAQDKGYVPCVRPSVYACMRACVCGHVCMCAGVCAGTCACVLACASIPPSLSNPKLAFLPIPSHSFQLILSPLFDPKGTSSCATPSSTPLTTTRTA